MFKNIVVPLDGSPMADRILPHVVAIAQSGSQPARVILLRVLETTDKASTAVDSLEWHFAKAEAQAHLNEAAAQLVQLGLAAKTVLLEGGAAQRIVEHVHKHGADLVVLSSHGQGGLSGWNVSGVAQKVIYRAGASIMLVRASDENTPVHSGVGGETIQYRHILAPLDGSQRAASALPLAIALTRGHGADLLVVHVVTRPEMLQRIPLSLEDAALSKRLVDRNVTEADKYFDQLRSRLLPNTQTRVLIDDSVTRALHDLVVLEQVDLVVLSAHGHSCYSQRPYGSLVDSFITYGATSLLILQDLASNHTRRDIDEHMTDEATLPARRSSAAEEGRNLLAHFEI
ncbi:MAG: universal stress protein [Caldilinea sp.]